MYASCKFTLIAVPELRELRLSAGDLLTFLSERLLGTASIALMSRLPSWTGVAVPPKGCAIYDGLCCSYCSLLTCELRPNVSP